MAMYGGNLTRNVSVKCFGIPSKNINYADFMLPF